MIGRKEIAFSNSQIEKAVARVAYQLGIVGNLLPGSNCDIARDSRDLLRVFRERLALLQGRHDELVASAADKFIDDQTELVASMVVGDPRKPEARHLLDKMHRGFLSNENEEMMS